MKLTSMAEFFSNLFKFVGLYASHSISKPNFFVNPHGSVITALSSANSAAVISGSQLNDFILNNGEWIVDEFAFAKKLVLAPVYAHQVANRGLYEKKYL